MNLRQVGCIAAALLIVIAAGNAEARPARCDLAIDGEGKYAGPCNFTPQGGGSYALTAINNSHNLIGTLESVAVWVGEKAELGPDEALYSYAERNGTGHNGSVLKRSKSKPACWVGESDHICVD